MPVAEAEAHRPRPLQEHKEHQAAAEPQAQFQDPQAQLKVVAEPQAPLKVVAQEEAQRPQPVDEAVGAHKPPLP
jgi:hypothetical protein